MIEIITIIVGIIVSIYIIWWVNKLPNPERRICDYCGKKTYIGTFSKPPENQHWREFPCPRCRAELVHKKETEP